MRNWKVTSVHLTYCEGGRVDGRVVREGGRKGGWEGGEGGREEGWVGGW